jgi:hypothetical protein
MSTWDIGAAGRIAARARRAQQAVNDLGAGPPPALPGSQEWRELTAALLELEAAGALDGIRAVIAERLHQVRKGWTPEHDREHMPGWLTLRAMSEVTDSGPGTPGWPGVLPRAAALLAAETDRTGAGS